MNSKFAIRKVNFILNFKFFNEIDFSWKNILEREKK